MSRPEPVVLSPAVQDYLKVVWAAGEWSTAPVTTKRLAERLGVGAPTVSEMVRRLCDQGLLSHVRYGAVELTAAGREHAVAVVRRHRLIETFLVRELGYGWDEVHDEAEVLEHAVSDLLVERMAARLGHPVRDPHGDPIPGPDGVVPELGARPLREVPPGEWAVARLSDADPSVLRLFDAVGIGLDVVVRVLGPTSDGGVRLAVPGRDGDGDCDGEGDGDGDGGGPGGEPVELTEPAASAVWLVPAGPARADVDRPGPLG